ncbi:MBL fold metallo-hydrolase [Streptomyces sp. NPDC002536]
MQTITLGAVEVTRVVEWHAPMGPVAAAFPGLTADKWREHASWLVPDFWDPEQDAFAVNVQTWVLRSGGTTVLVDTGVGNDKERPYMPAWTHMRTGYLERLAAAGVRPEDVDVVVNTHLHPDHVGWNTRLVDGDWVPTFPNATYLIPRSDFDHWNPAGNRPKRGALGDVTVEQICGSMFEDSILPVHRAGRAVLWEGERHRIDAALTLEAAPGHTPGSCIVRLESGTDRALFVGDAMHTPLQFAEPDCDTCLSEDQAGAVRTRRRILEEAADTRALVFPGHFPGHGGAEVRREGSAFAISRWAPFDRT